MPSFDDVTIWLDIPNCPDTGPRSDPVEAVSSSLGGAAYASSDLASLGWLAVCRSQVSAPNALVFFGEQESYVCQKRLFRFWPQVFEDFRVQIIQVLLEGTEARQVLSGRQSVILPPDGQEKVFSQDLADTMSSDTG